MQCRKSIVGEREHLFEVVGPMDVAQEGLRAIGQTVCSTDDFLNAVVLYNMVGAGGCFCRGDILRMVALILG